jgi:hypothetical protein
MTMLRRNIFDNRHPEGAVPHNDPGFWIQERVHYRDFNVAATTINYDLTGWQSTALVIQAFIRANVNWLGGAIATATMSLGTTASPAAYVAAVSVFSACPKTLPGTAQVPGTFVNAASPLLPGTIRCQLILTGANGTALTQGHADIFMWIAGVKINF